VTDVSSLAGRRIVRVWRGYGTAEGVERYCHEHFTRSVLPQLRATDGFLGAPVLVGPSGVESETEVVVLTEWASIEAIRAFAGGDVTRAVVEPAVRSLLTRFEDRVVHYDLSIDA